MIRWLIKEGTEFCQQREETLVLWVHKYLNCGEDCVERQHDNSKTTPELPLLDFKLVGIYLYAL